MILIPYTAPTVGSRLSRVDPAALGEVDPRIRACLTYPGESRAEVKPESMASPIRLVNKLPCILAYNSDLVLLLMM